MAGAVVRLVRTAGLPVLRQLQLEEALLRADAGHWCLINDGAAHTTAVLGISGCVAHARLRRQLLAVLRAARARRAAGAASRASCCTPRACSTRACLLCAASPAAAPSSWTATRCW
jgi:hypothetical protein